MSVIRFNEKEILKVRNALLQRVSSLRNGAVYYAVRYAPITIQKLEWDSRIEKEGEEEVLEGVVSRLMWYVWIANKTAYALQYQDEPDFFGDFTEAAWDRESGGYLESLELWRELRSIQYNLATNDGHTFLAEPWQELLDRIMNAVANQIVENSEPALAA